MNKALQLVQSHFRSALPLSLFFLVFAITSHNAAAGTFFLSPGGADANAGNSAASPWRTFGYAIPKLKPGDTLMLGDGRYTSASSGYLNVVCGSNAGNGAEGSPITVKAINERKASLEGDGTTKPVYLFGCSYWTVEGVQASSGDYSSESGDEAGSVFVIKKSSNVILRRSVGQKPNRYLNAHVYNIVASTNSVLEECEAYKYHRHGISVYNSSFMTIRRNYSNPRGYSALSGYNFGPQEGMNIYLSNDSIIENNIVEGSDNLANTGSRNRIFGNVSLNAANGFATGHHCCVNVPAVDNIYVDNVAVGNKNGFLTQSESKATFVNNTAINNAGTGYIGNNKYSYPNGASWTVNPNITVQNGLSINNSVSGFYFEYVTQYSGLVLDTLDAYGNSNNYSSGTELRTNAVSINPAMGSCKVFIPANSPLKGSGAHGADIGANVLYRYVDGRLTGIPLWDPSTGAFSCGAVIAGLNDVAGSSCFDVHQRLNVNTNGCALPAGYTQFAGPKAPTNLRSLP